MKVGTGREKIAKREKSEQRDKTDSEKQSLSGGILLALGPDRVQLLNVGEGMFLSHCSDQWKMLPRR